MRKLLIDTMGPVLWVMAAFDFLAIITMLKQHRLQKTNRIPLLTALLCVGLFYDALILASGTFMQFSAVFRILSQFRYILHLVMIPLLFPLCTYSLTDKEKVIRIIWILTVIIMALGLYAGITMKTEPRTVGTLNRYAQSDDNSALTGFLTQFLDIVPVFVMIFIGIYLYFKKKNPHLFFAGFFMLLFTLLGIFLGKDPAGDRTQSLMFYISMFGESFMVFFLYQFMRKE